jgi:hypothetical protein
MGFHHTHHFIDTLRRGVNNKIFFTTDCLFVFTHGFFVFTHDLFVFTRDLFCTKGLELLPRQLFIFYSGDCVIVHFLLRGLLSTQMSIFFQNEVFRPCFLPNDCFPIRKTLFVLCAVHLEDTMISFKNYDICIFFF